MNALETFLFSLNLLFLFAQFVSSDSAICKQISCDPSGSVPVRFPFRLNPLQPAQCGYNPTRSGSGTAPGRFDLSCDHLNRTVIDFARPGSAQNLFVVERIDYAEQSVWLTDPARCLPRRFLDGDLTRVAFTFRPESLIPLTFSRCGSNFASAHPEAFPVPCLTEKGDNRIVVVSSVSFPVGSPAGSPARSPAGSPGESPVGCEEIGVVEVPVGFGEYSVWPWTDVGPVGDFLGAVKLTWRFPVCRECERRGGVCGYRDGPGSRVGCSVSMDRPTGLPRSAKYGIIIGIGIPSLLCMIGLASYIWGRLRAYGQHGQPYRGRADPQRSEPVVVLTGLDGPTIESFPKIELGESKRLPKPNDNTCPICLCDYQPKETLRTIPDCDHYFHATCVDEWLKMNATCPLCRNSPDGSSRVCSSVSASSSSLSSLSSH